MPLGAALAEAEVALVGRWIDEGASLDCSGSPTDPPPMPVRHHPDGFADPAVHGTELKLGLQDCRTCHGSDLGGGVGPSCDSCHDSGTGWRTQCTFCHGGTVDQTGAPPRDLSGITELARLTFRAHPAHVSASNHAAYDCTECHTKPTNVLSMGHVFDDTPGRAEVDFSAGKSAGGNYPGDGRCSNLYCHGNGNGRRGAWAHDRGKPTCTTCHAGAASGESGWETMSGEHAKHLDEGLSCADCYADTAASPTALVADPSRHVDGEKTLRFTAPGFTRQNGTCSGVCHLERHRSRRWE
jgi:predicted CxxxxCH...CXXCH cytochrome family protein